MPTTRGWFFRLGFWPGVSGELSRPPTWRGLLCSGDPGPAGGQGLSGWAVHRVWPEPWVSTVRLAMRLQESRRIGVLFSLCDPWAQLFQIRLASLRQREGEPSATGAGLRMAQHPGNGRYEKPVRGVAAPFYTDRVL